jgi:hypothetical protein
MVGNYVVGEIEGTCDYQGRGDLEDAPCTFVSRLGNFAFGPPWNLISTTVLLG